MLTKELEIKQNFHEAGKFRQQQKTRKGDDRAFVEMEQLKTLWFNTGTRCNLQCDNCYIESSPTNDALVFITKKEVDSYLNEIEELKLDTSTISFTGGEPFLNKEIMPILEECLRRGFDVLVLTNAYRAIDKHLKTLYLLNETYPGKLTLRVSLDHYTKDIHEQERGKKTFDKTIATIKEMVAHGLTISLAGRSLANESRFDALQGYQQLMDQHDIELTVSTGENIVIFPEMSTSKDVPEITTGCWEILNVHPHQQMCAHERMVVKRKGAETPVVLACTLIAYDPQFEMGTTLKESFNRIYLNHPYCAQFCVLGGASCSG